MDGLQSSRSEVSGGPEKPNLFSGLALVFHLASVRVFEGPRLVGRSGK